MNFLSFLFPTAVYKISSPINGKIKVIKQFGKYSIKVSKIQQSGPLVETIWEHVFEKIKQTSFKNCLILGLAGGSSVKILNKHYPKAKIIGVEIDPLMIKLGKKYFKLSKYKNLTIKIEDGINFVKNLNNSCFDLILVDIYLGKNIPKEAKNEKFLKNLKKTLKKDGIIVFNYLRDKNNPDYSGQKLKTIFSDVKITKPLVNQLFICQ